MCSSMTYRQALASEICKPEASVKFIHRSLFMALYAHILFNHDESRNVLHKPKTICRFKDEA